MKKEISYDQALQKMAALCSQAEHCESELREKLARAGIGTGDADRIIDYLYDEGYINNERYCRAFVRDKFNYAHWGRIKIGQALRLKHLPDALVRQALDEEMPHEAYHALLQRLLRQKDSTLPADTDAYSRRAKLIRFALGRGFTLDEVLDAVGHEE